MIARNPLSIILRHGDAVDWLHWPPGDQHGPNASAAVTQHQMANFVVPNFETGDWPAWSLRVAVHAAASVVALSSQMG